VALIASSLSGDPGRTLTESELEVLEGAVGILSMDLEELLDRPEPARDPLELQKTRTSSKNQTAATGRGTAT
jgi:hypothetical protein